MVQEKTPFKQLLDKNFKPTIATSDIEDKETKKNNSKNVSEFNFFGKKYFDNVTNAVQLLIQSDG